MTFDNDGRRRARVGWYAYDWANSVFTTTVTSIFFGPFITEVCERAAGLDGYLDIAGIDVRASSFFPYVVALSVMLQIFVLPTTAVLTKRHDKGVLLGTLSTLGAGATIGMYGIGETDFALGGALYVVATMALGASIAVANTYLPILSAPEHRDRTSTYGSAAGFLGGAVMLAAALAVYSNHAGWGIPEQQVERSIMLAAGVWWLVFGAVSVWLLRGYGAPRTVAVERVRAYRTLLAAVRQLPRHPGAAWFLVAFLFYNNGLQSVTSLVGTYAAIELRLDEGDVVTAVLLVQFVAFAGAVIAGRLAERYGGRSILAGIVAVWMGVIVVGAAIPEGSFTAFLTLCVTAGLVVGGTYALSRSVFIQLVPDDQVPEYVGVFETVNRCVGFIGPATFGVVLQWTGEYRVAWASILVFWLAGGVALALGVLARRTPPRQQLQRQKRAMPHG